MKPLPASSLDAVLFDFDGVLTDNSVIVFEDGREAVICNRADGLAFDFLRASGLPAHIVSTETNPVVLARAKKLRIEAIHGLEDKVSAMETLCRERNYEPGRLMFIGNDVNDLPVMGAVGYPVAVADAHSSVRQAAWRVLKTRGGDGVAREIVESLIEFDRAFIS